MDFAVFRLFRLTTSPNVLLSTLCDRRNSWCNWVSGFIYSNWPSVSQTSRHLR